MSFRWIVRTTGGFDSPQVRRQIAAFERRWLFRMGSFTRTAARQSMRKRRGLSKPGSPPSSHSGGLKNSIQFAVEIATKSVVIGPSVNFQRTQGTPDRMGANLLEFGGVVVRRDARGKRRRQRYSARPFMRPALRKMAVDLARKYPTELPRMFNAVGGAI